MGENMLTPFRFPKPAVPFLKGRYLYLLFLAEEQLKDPHVCSLIGHLDSSALSLERSLIRHARDFILENGVLLRKDYASDRLRKVCFVPHHLEKGVLLSLHDALKAASLRFCNVPRRANFSEIIERAASASPRSFSPRRSPTGGVADCSHCVSRGGGTDVRLPRWHAGRREHASHHE